MSLADWLRATVDNSVDCRSNIMMMSQYFSSFSISSSEVFPRNFNENGRQKLSILLLKKKDNNNNFP